MESNDSKNDSSSGSIGSNEDKDKDEDQDERENNNNHINKTNSILSNKIEEVVSNDTNDVEKILINEMNNCTIKDRTEIQEELHGVLCLATVETPELLTRSLNQLSIELDNDDHIPQDEKRAYILSQQLQKEQEQEQEHEQHSNHQHQDSSRQQQQQQQNVLYVNSIEFRLMYLRRGLFDVKKTAKRIVQALDLLLEIYGEYALERKIKLSDLTKNELKIMKKGCVQLLPSRDRGGRRIIVVFPAKYLGHGQRRTVQKITFYLCLVCASDIENQRKGIIFVLWAENIPFNKFRFNRPYKSNFFLAPVRVVSIHFCANYSILTHLAKSAFVARLKTEQRIRFISHFGDGVENRYSLQSYGLPVDTLPITWTGTVKTENIKRSMNLRSYVESGEYEANNNNNINRRFSSITDCPYLNDILFKKGHHASLHHHSGNDRFRGIVHSVYEQHLQQHQRRQQQHGTSNGIPLPPSVPVSRQLLIPDIMKGIKQENLRVLVWNPKNCWWECISDECHYEKQVYTSAFYFLKESTSSSPLVQPPKSIATAAAATAATPKSTATATAKTTSTSKSMLKRRHHQQQQVSQSDTSIFISSQDDKKRKMSCFSSPNQDDLSVGGSSEDNDSAECFGLPFQCIPCKNNDSG